MIIKLIKQILNFLRALNQIYFFAHIINLVVKMIL